MAFIKEAKPKLHIPGYDLFYTDKKTGRHKDNVIYSKLLRSEKHGLTGKPDFIFRRGGKMAPVELKSGKIGEAGVPREGDLMQLTAYFIIIRDEFGVKPKFGRIIYGDSMFIIKNRWYLRRRFLKTVKEMREMLETGKPGKQPEPGFAKCRYCVCRETVCGLQDK